VLSGLEDVAIVSDLLANDDAVPASLAVGVGVTWLDVAVSVLVGVYQEEVGV